MASEWARGKVERIIKLAECIHEDDCEGPYGEEPCDCWVAEVRQEIAAALDEARREGAERERWECWSDIERYLNANADDMTQQAKDAFMFVASRLIAARGPMRGPEEE